MNQRTPYRILDERSARAENFAAAGFLCHFQRRRIRITAGGPVSERTDVAAFTFPEPIGSRAAVDFLQALVVTPDLAELFDGPPNVQATDEHHRRIEAHAAAFSHSRTLPPLTRFRPPQGDKDNRSAYRRRHGWQPGDEIIIDGREREAATVLERIRRARPAFVGYRVRLHTAKKTVVEIPEASAQEPPRRLLQEYRHWRDEILGPEFVAVLDEERYQRLRFEFSQARPQLVPYIDRIGPVRVPGVKPLHHVSRRRQIKREHSWSSNGAHQRAHERVWYWLECTCTWTTAVEGHLGVWAAEQRAAEHEATHS